MDRFILTDAQWTKMEPHCLGKPTDPGARGATTGCSWIQTPALCRFIDRRLASPGGVAGGAAVFRSGLSQHPLIFLSGR